MSTFAPALTVEEFLSLQDGIEQTVRRELIEGEITEMGSGRWEHETVKSNIIQHLAYYLVRNPIGKLFSETAFRLKQNTALMPDISVLLVDVPRPKEPGLIPGAPELAIEVISSEPAARLEQKIQLYFENGSRSVWAFYPESRSVTVHKGDGTARRRPEGQFLDDPDLLPGFRIPVSAFFEGL